MFKLMSTDFLGRFWNITIFVSSDKYVTSSCFAIWMLHFASVCTPWMLHVSSVCTPCCMLLDVFACCCAKFETCQTFQQTTLNILFVPWSPKSSATMLDPFAQLFQHCWGYARSLRMAGLQRLMGCILPTMHRRSQTCWKLLRPFARSLRMKRVYTVVQFCFRSW